jgi:hypothetical protein
VTVASLAEPTAATTPPRPAGPGARTVAWLAEHRVWLLVVVAYLSVFPYSPAINNPNENVRIYMSRALVEHHTLAINQIEAEWGWVNDKAKSGDRLFSSKAPGLSLLGVPVLGAETWLWHRLGWRSPSKLATTFGLRMFAVMVPMCAFLLAFVRYLRRISGSRPMADLLLVAVGLGSLLYPYGIHFVGHGVAAALTFAAFMVLAPDGTITRSSRRGAVGGLLAGLGVVFEYQNLLVAILLGVYVAVRRPRILPAFALGALPAAALLGVMHTLCFGRPWAFPYGHLENVEFQTVHHHNGFYGVVGPARAAILGVLFLPGFGFFACSPFLVVAALAVGWMLVRGPRAEGALIASVALALTVFVAGLPNWRGGWSVGPRYIAAVVPYLAVALGYAWPGVVRRRFARPAWSVTAGLVLVGIFLNALAAVIYPQFPPQLRNPAFQLTLRLLRDGYFPYSLGHALGLRGWASLAPTGLALVLAVALALGSDPVARPRGDTPASPSPSGWPWRSRPRLSSLVLTAAVFGGLVVGLSAWPARPSVAEREAVQVVEGAFSPPPVAPARRAP